MINNPYTWNSVKPELCYGRDALLSELLTGLPGGSRQSFGLAGGRRMGKSTLLRRVELDLRASLNRWLDGGLRVVPIYIDGLALPRPLVADYIWGYIVRQLQQALPQQVVMPSSIPLDFDTFKQTLEPILVNLAERPRIIVIFDEIELITEQNWADGFWSHWRALLSNTPNLSDYFTAVFAGARELSMLKYDIGSPLADVLEEWQSLRCLEFEDACRLMQEPIEKEWSHQFLDKIYQETGGHPFLIQYVMQHVCNSLPSTELESLQSVNQAINKFKRRWQFGEWWEKFLDETARKVYSDLPDDKTLVDLRTLTKKFHSSGVVNQALEILQHVGVVTSEDDNLAFRYNGEMFRRWYRENFLAQYQPNSIRALIANGENQNVEFKSSIWWSYRLQERNDEITKDILKTIAGFLNADGGKILVGVDNDGNIIGLTADYQMVQKTNRDGYELSIMQKVESKIGKEFCPYLNISFQEIDDKDICLISVEAAPKPAYVKGENRNSTFFVRVGNQTLPYELEVAINYISSHWDKK